MGYGEANAVGHTELQAPPAWQAPSEVERRLYEAKLRGDWSAFFDCLAEEDLFFADSVALIEADPGTYLCTPYWYSQVRANCLPLLTHGMLPAPDAETAFCRTDLGWLADGWRDSDTSWIVINPGSPCEVFFPATPSHRALWQQHVRRLEQCDCGRPHHRMRLRALEGSGAATGAVAHGLGLIALLSVSNGDLWNAIDYHGTGYKGEKNRLKEWWGITSREEWRHHQEQLLEAGQVGGGAWEFVLGIRRSLSREFGGPVEVDQWRQAAEKVLRRGTETTEYRLSADGVTKVGPLDGAEVAARIAGVQRLIGRIARYEKRFRADGLLAEGKFVPSVEAWDYGRAAGMARWGLGARYCDQREAENAIARASRLGRLNYRSWEEFSASFILGRCLHFDEEEFGTWYQDMLEAHRILTTDPGSPWLTVPWK
ncbi:DUF1266 domain-containing protein [Streptomyces sp. NPDC019937]|uniref:DUF1266 domain-containing protein n=1 Tax=Streptomyces sp. NPDC019937 TaxID=3154787 RepID=UPI0033E6245F